MSDRDQDRFDRLSELYPVRFPEEALALWRLARERGPRPREAFGQDAISVRLVGPFEVMAGLADGKKFDKPLALHGRGPRDPAEFFTVAESTADGFRWGYWFDTPDGPPVVAAYDQDEDELEIALEGGSLAQALVRHLEATAERLEEDKQYDPDGAEFYDEGLAQVASAREGLLGFARTQGFDLSALPERDVVAPTTDGMGVVGDRESFVELMPVADLSRAAHRGDVASLLDRAEAALKDGYPSTAIQVGRAIWMAKGSASSHPRAVELMARAYESIARQGLAEVARAHGAHRSDAALKLL